MSGLTGDRVTAPETKTMRIVSCPVCGRIACQATGDILIRCKKCAAWFCEKSSGESEVLKDGKMHPQKPSGANGG